jgi:hypothetical protein
MSSPAGNTAAADGVLQVGSDRRAEPGCQINGTVCRERVALRAARTPSRIPCWRRSPCPDSQVLPGGLDLQVDPACRAGSCCQEHDAGAIRVSPRLRSASRPRLESHTPQSAEPCDPRTCDAAGFLTARSCPAGRTYGVSPAQSSWPANPRNCPGRRPINRSNLRTFGTKAARNKGGSARRSTCGANNESSFPGVLRVLAQQCCFILRGGR